MAIIVTYDVPVKHVALKQLLFSRGYTDTISHFQDGKYLTIYLPNTTLFHPLKTSTQGRQDIKECSATLQIKLERCISTQWGPDWAAIFGEPYKQ
ncbi:MAG TPA: hypothetical protein VGM63_00245 [Mucilaginibacter sp.]|jgi:hypothetical protein